MLDLKDEIRFLPIHLINPMADKKRSVYIGEELESLIQTFGGEIVESAVQKLDAPDNRTYIGSGKVAEVLEIIKEKKVDVVVLNAMAKPGQIHALKKALRKANPEIEVWDRVDLILQIFDKHATTTEAKLQIELARMRYMGPRIYGMGFVMSRQGGGIGTSGVGETNTELMKRHWRAGMKKITDQLDKLAKTRSEQLERRKRAGLVTVSIVGYTNAGKSSLFNVLTKKKTLVENALFATLDSNVGRLYLPQLQKEVLITDTIGFIRNLPPRLINAFKSTLMESIHADIVLHVIDASDEERETKIKVVSDILVELGIDLDNVIFVFNKIDATDVDRKQLAYEYQENDPIFVSAKTGEGIEYIKKMITNKIQS